ncbi:hypothetical protein Pelo_8008 [Pelomyxa schiedti]|nr:hypothetical protein Pelo_8008 [Pelomyxa schiedti]
MAATTHANKPELIKILLLGRQGCGKSSTANTMEQLLSGEPVPTMPFTVGDGGQQHTTSHVRQVYVPVERSGRVTTYVIIDTPGLATGSSEAVVRKWWIDLKTVINKHNPDVVMVVAAAQDFGNPNSPQATSARKLARNLGIVQGYNFCACPVPIIITHVSELTTSLSAGDAVIAKALKAIRISTNFYPVENYGKELGPPRVDATNASLGRLFNAIDKWRMSKKTEEALGLHAAQDANAVVEPEFYCQLTIARAWWGWDRTNPAYGMDVTAFIQGKVEGLNTLPPLKPATVGFERDPCPHWRKKLWISYRYNNDNAELECSQNDVCCIPKIPCNWPIWDDQPMNVE